MGKKIFWVAITIMAILIAIVGWREFGRWLAWAIGTVGMLLGGAKLMEQQERERIEERNRRIKADIERQEAIEAGLEAETESWRDRVDKLRRGGLLVLVLTLGLMFAGPVRAQDVYIPADYDSLKTAYVLAWELLDEADQIMINQQALIQDKDQTIVELQEIVSDQEKRIYRLTKPSWGITGGVEVGDGGGAGAGWKLGIARKWNGASGIGAISVAGGIGGERFCIWGAVTLWW